MGKRKLLIFFLSFCFFANVLTSNANAYTVFEVYSEDYSVETEISSVLSPYANNTNVTRNCLFNYEGGENYNYNNTVVSPNLGILGNAHIEEVTDYNWATGETYARNALVAYSNITIRRVIEYEFDDYLEYSVVCDSNFTYIISDYSTSLIYINLTVTFNSTGGNAHIEDLSNEDSIDFTLIEEVTPKFYLVVNDSDLTAQFYVNTSQTLDYAEIPTGFLPKDQLYADLDVIAGGVVFGENYNLNVPFTIGDADEWDITTLTDYGTPGENPDNPPIAYYEYNTSTVEVLDNYMEHKQVLNLTKPFYNGGFCWAAWNWNESIENGRCSFSVNFDNFNAANTWCDFRLTDDSYHEIIAIRINYQSVGMGDLTAFDGGTPVYYTGYTLAEDTWGQYIIEYDSTTYTYDLYYNGFPVATGLDWTTTSYGNPSNSIYLTTTFETPNYSIYIDELTIAEYSGINDNYENDDITEVVGVSEYYYAFDQLMPNFTNDPFNYTIQNASLLHGLSYYNAKYQNAMVLEGNGSTQELDFIIDSDITFDGSESFCVLMPVNMSVNTQKIYFDFDDFYIDFYKTISSGQDAIVVDKDGSSSSTTSLINSRSTSVILFVIYLPSVLNDTIYAGFISDESILVRPYTISGMTDLAISISGTLPENQSLTYYGALILGDVSTQFTGRDLCYVGSATEISRYHNDFWLPQFRQTEATITHSLEFSTPTFSESGYNAYYYYPLLANVSQETAIVNDTLEITSSTGMMWSNWNASQFAVANTSTDWFFPLIYQTTYTIEINASIVIDLQPISGGEYTPRGDLYATSTFNVTITWWVYASEIEEEFDLLNQLFDLITPLLLVFIFPYIIYSATKKTLFALFGVTIGAVVSIIAGMINVGQGMLLVILSFLLIAYVVKRQQHRGGAD